MANWFKELLTKQGMQSVAEGATVGISKATSPVLGQMYATATAPFYGVKREDIPSGKESFQIYNDQREEWKKENFYKDLAFQTIGSAPLAAGLGGANILKQMAFGAGTSGINTGSDITSKSIAADRELNKSDFTEFGLSSGIGALAAPVGSLIGKSVDEVAKKALNKPVPYFKEVYKKIINDDPAVEVLVDNIKKYPQEKIVKIKDFLDSTDVGDFAALKENSVDSIGRNYQRGITTEMKPQYDKIFFRTNKMGQQEPYKIPPTELTKVYKNEKYSNILDDLTTGLEDDARLILPSGEKIPQNSLAYNHALRSQAKRIYRKIKDNENYRVGENLGYKNDLKNFINDIDKVIDKNIPTARKTNLALADERYNILQDQKEAALGNLISKDITKTNKNRILQYAGADYEPQIDVLDIINRANTKTLKLTRTPPQDAYREGQIAVDLAFNNYMGATRNVGKIIARKLGGGKPQETSITSYGNFLTAPEGKNLLSQLAEAKNIGERNDTIQKGVSEFFSKSGMAAGISTSPVIAQNLASRTPDSMKQEEQIDELFLNPKPFDFQNDAPKQILPSQNQEKPVYNRDDVRRKLGL